VILTKRRLIRYLTPVLALAIIYNINRFFEAEVEWVQIGDDCDTGNTSTCTYIPRTKPTSLRLESETYNLCVLSIRCLVLGLFPVMILGFLNTKIYKDVRERRARNVPVGSSSLSNNRGQGTSFQGINQLQEDQQASWQTKFKLSSIHERMSFKRKTNGKRARIHQKSNGVSSTNSTSGIRTAIVIQEMIPLR
jgi:hypothetical protein